MLTNEFVSRIRGRPLYTPLLWSVQLINWVDQQLNWWSDSADLDEIEYPNSDVRIMKQAILLSVTGARPLKRFMRHSMPDLFEIRFKNTQFVVEATDCERQMLWERFCRDTIHPSKDSKHTWKQLNPGCMYKVGEVNSNPVNVICCWALIDDMMVMFYTSCSRIIDIIMIEKWITDKCRPRWDNGNHEARTNAMNFHDVIHYIGGSR